jgi:hypothetical protein
MAATALLVALLFGYVTYVGLRLRATYNLATEVGLLRQKYDQVLIDATSIHVHIEERLDKMERFLFGDVLESLQKTGAAPPKTTPSTTPPSTSIQVWQRTRDKELRDRLDMLERLRLKNEMRIEQLEREVREIKREIR